jgi:hypothetical protein
MVKTALHTVDGSLSKKTKRGDSNHAHTFLEVTWISDNSEVGKQGLVALLFVIWQSRSFVCSGKPSF